MTDEYLWDRTGAVDPMVAGLERSLAVLRLPLPLRAPVIEDTVAPRRPAPRRARLGSALATAVLAAAATGALIWAWVSLRDASSLGEEATVPRDVPQAQVERTIAVAVPPLPDPVPAPVVKTPPPVVQPEPPTAEAVATPPHPKPTARSSKRSRGTSDVRKVKAPQPPPTAVKPLLTQQDIKDGLEPVKADAKACGGRHGALPGEKVVVKLSIAGADGRVTHATATGPHYDTPLGKCVAEALSQARFPSFDRETIGVQYPVKM